MRFSRLATLLGVSATTTGIVLVNAFSMRWIVAGVGTKFNSDEFWRASDPSSLTTLPAESRWDRPGWRDERGSSRRQAR
jgi:hypothetical protein